MPVLAHAYNSICHESTGYVSHYLMFGRYPRLAVDAFFDIKPDSEQIIISMHTFLVSEKS